VPSPQAIALADVNRANQLALRARLLREFLILAPAWSGDAASFETLIAATVPLVQLRHRDSAALAAALYRAVRAAEIGSAAVDVALAETPPAEQIASSMWATGQSQVRRSLTAGMSGVQARQQALVRVSGAVSRITLNGGRDTVVESTKRDRQAVGWYRVTAGKPCSFCVMLSSRGIAYRTQASAGFKAHDHCLCSAAPSFTSRDDWPDQNLKHRALWQRSQREAREAGTLDTGAKNPALNALERLMRSEGLLP
jgi:hypothetical protein